MYISENYVENEYATFWIHNGILFYVYKPNTTIDLYAAQKTVADRVKFQHKVAYPILYDVRGIVEADKAGRDYMGKRGYLLTKAVGFLVPPPVSIGLVPFFLEIHQPHAPTRLFTEEDQAIKFLKSYVS
ncbi:hypothetical protein LS482_17190 [Sinomicrobium kalidii]|uniref:DUF7793 family protein n=1 Tax=Sinomicrobium kalidii TaxID=2900738 RepID=UPI001E5D5F20|nr:hypothetical protein [Sinomicrobium kalidii]UGU15404.1 hypothetical protein LS482_17190 [Sinomicrobium kalidii]